MKSLIRTRSAGPQVPEVHPANHVLEGGCALSACSSIVLLALAALLGQGSPARGAEPVTLRSLLNEMTDREQLTRFPAPAYTSQLFSSHDRASVAPDKPGWFANDDSSQFVRQERNGDRIEHVMLETNGPGAIVRFWVTIAGADGSGILRIYLDRAERPVVEGKVLEIVSGGKLCGEPLSTFLRGA